MLVDLLLTALGLALLIGAGDALVRGAVALSLRLGVSALIVSLTVVAFGTSAPELLVGVQAALAGAEGIIFGNVVGSNIANVLLVLGVPALVAPFAAVGGASGRSFWIMIAASILFIALCFTGPLGWPHGLALLLGLGLMLGDAFRTARRDRKAAAALMDVQDVDPRMAGWKMAALIAAGIVGLPLGANFLVEGATGIAMAAGVSEAAIGLTLVAIGTSLPELVTTVTAAVKRQAEVVVGNVIGSNLFNLLGIMGVVSFLGPLPVPPEMLRLDLWVMLACALALWPFVFRDRRFGRRVGLLFVGLYLAFGYAVLGARL